MGKGRVPTTSGGDFREAGGPADYQGDDFTEFHLGKDWAAWYAFSSRMTIV